jgi:hypothetical protein
MPLYVLKEEMPYEELLGWFAYLEKRPVGWREDMRIYHILQTQGYKDKPSEIFPSLAVLTNSENKLIDGQIDINNLKNSYLFKKIAGAKGGEKIDFGRGE